MTTSLYGPAAEALLTAGLDLSTLELRTVLVDSGAYTVNLATHQFLSDVAGGARIAVSAAMASVTTTGGVLDAADVVLSAVTGTTCEALIIYAHAPTVGGTPYADGAAPLIAYIGDATGLPVTPDGTDVTIAWSSGGDRILSLA